MSLLVRQSTLIINPNMLALAFITGFDGSWQTATEVVGAHTFLRVTYHRNQSDFINDRIHQISNVVPTNIVLFDVDSTFSHNGIPITQRAAITAWNSISQGPSVFWDQSNCDGERYHVFDQQGQPFEFDLSHLVFHELSHAFHIANGTHPMLDSDAEILAITETNLLRQLLQLTLRDPNNHAGGCGPGPEPPSWWKDLIKAFVGNLSTVLQSSLGPGGGRPREVRVRDIFTAVLFECDQQFKAVNRPVGDVELREKLRHKLISNLNLFYLLARPHKKQSTEIDKLLQIFQERSSADVGGYTGAADLLTPARHQSSDLPTITDLFIARPFHISEELISEFLSRESISAEFLEHIKYEVNQWLKDVGGFSSPKDKMTHIRDEKFSEGLDEARLISTFKPSRNSFWYDF